MQRTVIYNRVKELITTIKQFDNLEEDSSIQLSYDTYLIDDLYFSSVDIITLVVLIEETFGIMIEDEELLSENFLSVKTIVEYITMKVKKDNE